MEKNNQTNTNRRRSTTKKARWWEAPSRKTPPRATSQTPPQATSQTPPQVVKSVHNRLTISIGVITVFGRKIYSWLCMHLRAPTESDYLINDNPDEVPDIDNDKTPDDPERGLFENRRHKFPRCRRCHRTGYQLSARKFCQKCEDGSMNRPATKGIDCCAICKKKYPDYLSRWVCIYCEKAYCDVHRLPENHKCKDFRPRSSHRA